MSNNRISGDWGHNVTVVPYNPQDLCAFLDQASAEGFEILSVTVGQAAHPLTPHIQGPAFLVVMRKAKQLLVSGIEEG